MIHQIVLSHNIIYYGETLNDYEKAIYSYGKLVGNYDNDQIFQGEKNLIIVLTLISKKSQI